MLTSANDDPALVAKQLNTKAGCLAQGAMVGRSVSSCSYTKYHLNFQVQDP